MVKKELWLKNNTGSDVNVGDLGVRVLANGTTNVYAYNPYITEQKVKNSIESGSLLKRLESGVLSVVRGSKNPNPHTLNHIKASSGPIEVVKSKSSVFIDTKEEDVLADEDLGDIADYGLGELGHNNTANVRTRDGSVVVEQKEDFPENEVSDVQVQFEKVKSSTVSEQSVVAVTKQVKAQIDPIGPMVKDSSPMDQPFVVINAPETEEFPILQETKQTNKVKKVGESFVVDGMETDKRSLKTPKAEVDSVINEESTTYDAQVATKDKNGSIVMQVKEVATEENVKVEKPKVAVKRKRARSKKK